jgi:lysozyme
MLERSRQPRTLSPSGVTFVAEHEGYRGKVYPDQAGNPTIGYGHLIRKGEDFSKGITPEQGQTLLQKDAQSAEQAVNKNVELWIPQNQFDALTSFTYNVGG